VDLKEQVPQLTDNVRTIDLRKDCPYDEKIQKEVYINKIIKTKQPIGFTRVIYVPNFIKIPREVFVDKIVYDLVEQTVYKDKIINVPYVTYVDKEILVDKVVEVPV